MKQILFNTDMVHAILAGRKTVTRRVAFPEKDLREFPRKEYPDGWWFRGRAYRNWDSALRESQGVMNRCKYRPGDILYVREAFQQNYDGSYSYRAGHKFEKCGGWLPSIHMPREAARIFLRVTDVWVERLQDITEEQTQKEGAKMEYPSLRNRMIPVTAKGKFSEIWNSTIKPADLAIYGWDANPWVWVIEFERIKIEEEICST